MPKIFRDGAAAETSALLRDSSLDLPSAAFDALPDGFFLFDPTRRLSQVNRAGSRLEKAEPRALKGRLCCDMFWRVEGAPGCLVERALASGETVEVEMMTGDRGTRPTLVTVVPVKDERGVLTGSTIVTARDLSELRRAEAEAFERKSFMASLADLLPDEVYTLDTKGRITWMNERAAAGGLSPPSGVLNRHFSEFVAEQSQGLVKQTLARTLAGEDAQCEIKTPHAGGAMRDTDVHTSPLWRDGNVSGALIFLRDVTERNRAHERLAQSDKLRAIGELAAGVAHNLNNTLTVIQGRAQLLQKRAPDEKTAKSLDVISRAVGDGARTLRRVLDFARRDPEKSFAPVDLGELLSQSVELAKPKWQNEAVRCAGEVTVQVELECDASVWGDGAELREVVLNLLFNAVDAMPDGGTIEVGARTEIDAACFWVADTGRGMPPEVVARVFEPFYTTKGAGGTGLGLAASHGIVARHNGRITVTSEPGEGTRFEVRLPRYENSSGENGASLSTGSLEPLDRRE